MGTGKVKNLILIMVFLFEGFLLSIANGKPSFFIERISTDYNGIAYNGKNILAYGKYGVITYSTDKGESWKQLCLGDSLELLKIINVDTVFYALTPYSILKSTDNGLHWKQRKFFDEPTFKDFTTDGKFFFAISSRAVFRIDVELSQFPETLYQFEFSSLNEIVFLQNYLFCIDSKYFLYRINIATLEVRTFDLHNSILKDNNDVRELSRIKVYNSNIYLLAESAYQNHPLYATPINSHSNIRHTLLRTTDFGESWSIVTKNIRLTKEYQVLNDTVYFLTQTPIINKEDNYFSYSIRYYTVDSTGLEIEINPDEVLDRRIDVYTGGLNDLSVPNTFGVNMFIHIDYGKLIAVGPNKTILMSKNKGLNWNLLSYFKPLVKSNNEIRFLGKDTILVLVDIRPYYFLSIDGGATFLPPKRFIDNFPEAGNFSLGKDGFFFFASKRIFSRSVKIDNYTYRTVYDSTKFEFFYTKDLGNTFSKFTFKRDFIFSNDTFDFDLIALKIFDEKILTTFGGSLNKTSDTIPDSYIYFFDKSFNIIDSIVLRKINFEKFSRKYIIEDTVIYLISNSFIIRGRTAGRLWDTLYSNLSDYNSFYFQYRNYLLILNTKNPQPNKYQYKLLIFNLNNFKMDSVELSPLPLMFFVFKDTIYGRSYDTPILYYFPYGIENMSLYDSIDVAPLLSNDGSFVDKLTNDGDISFFHLLKRVGSGLFATYYDLNLGKIVYETPRFLPVESVKSENGVYLFNYPPYPNPAENIVEVHLLWDKPLFKNELKIEIFDIFGNMILPPAIEFLSMNEYSGIIRIDCSHLSNGTYAISVKTSSKSLLIPFLVLK